jgi:hypothetical protein
MSERIEEKKILLLYEMYIIVQEPSMLETLSKNITRQGLTATTLNYLRVSRAEMSGRLEELPLEAAAERAAFMAAGGPAGNGGGGGAPPDGLESLDFNDPYSF